MKNSIGCSLLISILVFSNGLHAQDSANSNSTLHLDFSVNDSATVIDNGIQETSTQVSTVDSVLRFQAHSGVYGELGFSRQNTYETEIGGNAVPIDENNNATLVGFGYRFSGSDNPNLYWGLGYQNSKFTESDKPRNTINTFWEKNNTQRYGRVEVALSTRNKFKTLGVSGRHVWFINSSLGLGVNWGLGSGYYESESGEADVAIGMGRIGAILMIRPRL